MTTAHDIDWPAVLAERLTTTHPDVLRELLATFIHTLMGAEADALCGAGYGQRSAERTNQHNGYRHRQFDTRTGTLDLAIPRLRHGSYFPDWLLERRKRAERALTTVVATWYLLGVSTRRMDKFVETLGITSLSKSQVVQRAYDDADSLARSRRTSSSIRRSRVPWSLPSCVIDRAPQAKARNSFSSSASVIGGLPLASAPETHSRSPVATILKPARSRALDTAASWVTTSLQSRACSIIKITPASCPWARRSRFGPRQWRLRHQPWCRSSLSYIPILPLGVYGSLKSPQR